MAGIYVGEWDGGFGGRTECNAGNKWSIERRAGVECSGESSGGFLHRGVSAGTWRGANGVLGGADEFSGNTGGSANDAGRGNCGSGSVDAVCEHGAGCESE